MLYIISFTSHWIRGSSATLQTCIKPPESFHVCSSAERFTDLRKFSQAASTPLPPYSLTPGLRFCKCSLPCVPLHFSFTHVVVRRAEITQYHTLGGFSTPELNFTQCGRLEIRAQGAGVGGGWSQPSLGCRLLTSHRVHTWQKGLGIFLGIIRH